MPNSNGVTDTSILESALIGFEYQHSKIAAKIVEIRRALGIRTSRTSAGTATPAKRKMSRSARQRIAAAQKKRWAAYKRTTTEAGQQKAIAPLKKRRMSAAAKKRISEATKKRWAAYRTQKAAKKPVAAKTMPRKPKAKKLPSKAA